MAVAWTWLAFPGLVAGVLSSFLAFLILRAGPSRVPNRRLALVLALEALGMLLANGGDLLLDAGVAVWVLSAAQVSFDIMGLAYLRFIALLDTPLVRPLRTRAALVALAAVAAVVLGTFVVLGPAAYVPSVERSTIVPGLGSAWAWGSSQLAFNPGDWVYSVIIIAPIFGLVAALSAFRRAAPGSAARQRARAYAIAFGVRDAAFTFVLLTATFLGAETSGAGGALWKIVLPAGTSLSATLIAWALLREQLFDIELRVKLGIQRGTVVAVFLAAFLAVGIVGGQFLVGAFSVLAGTAGAVVLLLAVVPLHRAAERLADKVLPGVSADDAYLAKRKLEVYRAAFEEAMTGPGADEAMLVNLRKSLGVSEGEHRALVLGMAPRALARHFDVERELGRGGSGQALLARDKALGRRVVLKRPLRVMSPDGRAQFLREARIMAGIQHPNVVTVHQVLEEPEGPVLVMEYIDGGSLADLLARRGPLPPAEAGRIALDALAGLARIHGAGVVHRDLKPGNILLDRAGRAKIADFGIAHRAGEASGLTLQGYQPGSPAYMSPEQARGEPLDARSDLYSLGLVLREALTGRPSGGTVAHGEERVAPSGKMSRALQAVIDRATEREPPRRFRDAEEMAAALRVALAELTPAAGAPQPER